MPKRAPTEKFQLRMTKRERASLAKLATSAGLTESAYLGNLLARQARSTIKPLISILPSADLDPSALAELIRKTIGSAMREAS